MIAGREIDRYASNSSPNSCCTQRARMERVGADSDNLITADHVSDQNSLSIGVPLDVMFAG
jgi:hypothetical protein